jgi:hypothetical protein
MRLEERDELPRFRFPAYELHDRRGIKVDHELQTVFALCFERLAQLPVRFPGRKSEVEDITRRRSNSSLPA